MNDGTKPFRYDGVVPGVRIGVGVVVEALAQQPEDGTARVPVSRSARFESIALIRR
jgi:hypothetical protein